MRTLVSILLALLVIGGGFLLYERHDSDTGSMVATTTEQSTASTTSTGSTTPVVTNDITVKYPTTGQTVSSPLSLSGEVRGNWYFEAVAPVYLEDADGTKIAQGHIQATGDWMTTNFVPFVGTLTWSTHSTSTTSARLVFMNDNPSGNPALQKMVVIPVTIAR